MFVVKKVFKNIPKGKGSVGKSRNGWTILKMIRRKRVSEDEEKHLRKETPKNLPRRRPGPCTDHRASQEREKYLYLV
jgi:RNA-splicing ligase RtcB